MVASLFLKTVILGNIREAYTKYVDQSLRHHNPYFPGNTEALIKGMEENHTAYPNKTLEIKHLIAEKDLVVAHSHLRLKPKDIGIITVHIFRFQNNRIAELWDVGQPIPEDVPNKNGIF